MDENCRPHRANLVEDFLFEEGIVRMEWPACSPDMNPIEHVWDALGRRVSGRQPHPQTLQELEKALLEEWDRIPQLMINSIIDSMPQRCSTLLAVLKESESDYKARAISDGFRHFEPRSSDEKDTCADTPPLSPNYHTNGRTLSLNGFNEHEHPLHGGSSVAPGSNS
ncbi:transposable element Tcb2 transposase [Trichonephila clavipes]|nr:transposable element Tcb2 transposase [Trichonephila clavipes]